MKMILEKQSKQSKGSKGRKKMNSTGKITKTTTGVIDGKFGKTEIVSTVVKTWSNMSKRNRVFVGAYAGMALCTFAKYTYNDSVDELHSYREYIKEPHSSCNRIYFTTHNTYSGKFVINSDTRAVRWGARRNSWNNFWGSVFLPFNIVTGFIPDVALWMNPPPPKSEPPVSKSEQSVSKSEPSIELR